MKVLVLGVSGMIGSTCYRVLSEREDWQVFGTTRSENVNRFFSASLVNNLISNIDVANHDALVRIYAKIQPQVVINCIGATKHKTGGNDPLSAIPLNAMLPHQLLNLCNATGARLIHVSTDCIFSGRDGNYTEQSFADADDVYGKSKALGEVSATNAVTLRTSTIGHELESQYGLLDWFLAQSGECKGFKRAIFSGLPTVEFARVIRDVVIPKTELQGLYNVAGPAIAKYELLELIAKIYNFPINIIPENDFVIDRSLDASLFGKATGYASPQWQELIQKMHDYQ